MFSGFAPARIAMTDARRGGDPLLQIGALSCGDALVFRHYKLDQPQRHELGKRLRSACRKRRLTFLVAGDPHLAHTLRADGLHLPGWFLKRGFDWHTRPKTRWYVTAAVHNASDLITAARAGVDACLLSPVFTTASHPGGQTLGPVRFAALTRQTLLPVYALGGITPHTAQRLKDAKPEGVAGIGGMFSSLPARS